MRHDPARRADNTRSCSRLLKRTQRGVLSIFMASGLFRGRLLRIEIYAAVIVSALCMLTVFEVSQRSLSSYSRNVTISSSGSAPWNPLAALFSRAVDDDDGVSSEASLGPTGLTCSAAANQWQHVEYEGQVLGAKAPEPSAGECCGACAAKLDCNAWNWCGNAHGCGSKGLFMECTLKQTTLQSVVAIEGFSPTKEGWVSGSSFSAAVKAHLQKEEQKRLHELRHKSQLPLVFLDVSIKGYSVGRVEIVLFKDAAPKAAENFRALCTGEKGIVPTGHKGAGKKYSLKGNSFYLLVDKLMNVAGAGTDSTFGGSFPDEAGGLALKHDRRGILTMVNDADDINTSDFAIMLMPAASLDGKYTVFGEVVSGLEIMYTINELARGKPANTVGLGEQVKIVDAGEIHRRADR